MPPANKQEARLVMWQRIVARLSVPLISLIILFGIALLPSYFLVFFQKEEVLRHMALSQQDPAQQKAKQVSANVADFQKKMRTAGAATASGRSVTVLFSDILSAVPAAIAIRTLDYDSTTRVISFDGFAASRTDILELERALRANTRVAKVDSPLSNVIKESNISFTMRITVQP